jgi:hypothetical protein
MNRERNKEQYEMSIRLTDFVDACLDVETDDERFVSEWSLYEKYTSWSMKRGRTVRLSIWNFVPELVRALLQKRHSFVMHWNGTKTRTRFFGIAFKPEESRSRLAIFKLEPGKAVSVARLRKLYFAQFPDKTKDDFRERLIRILEKHAERDVYLEVREVNGKERRYVVGIVLTDYGKSLVSASNQPTVSV